MSSENDRSNASRRKPLDLAVLLAILLLVRFSLFAVIPRQALSFDMDHWDEVAAALDHGVNPYRATTHLNWPPFWMQIIFILNKAAKFFAVELATTVRLCLMIAEAALAAALYLILSGIAGARRAFWVVTAGVALNPVCAFLVIQHANFDVIAALFMTVAAGFLLRYGETRDAAAWLWATAFLGLGVLTKTVPIFLAPIFFLAYTGPRFSEKLLGALFIALPTVLGLSVLFVLSPDDIRYKVLAYQSFPGFFGVTGLLHYFRHTDLIPAYGIVFQIFLLLFLAAFCLFLFRTRSKERPPETVFLCAALPLVLLPVLGPGYGAQYAYWFIPFLVLIYAMTTRGGRAVLLAWYAVAALTYYVEYGFLGWQLLVEGTPQSLAIRQAFAGPKHLTLLRLPLFAASLMLLAWISVRIAQSRKSGSKTPS